MTKNDFIEIVVKKICAEATKALIRHDYPPHIADWKCNVIDMVERADYYMHFLDEWKNGIIYQQRM